jgi:RraA family protein
MTNVGMRIYQKIKRPSDELIRRVGLYAVSNLSDAMGRFFCAVPDIRPFNDVKLLGTAFTVRVPAGDNLMFHKAIDIAMPGDVLVIDAQGDTTRAQCGEIMAGYAVSRGLAGFVVDGVIRDSDAIRDLKMAVYAKGVSPLGPSKNGPGEINVPISCGGVIVKPGYIVVGDADGVVFIDPVDAEEVIEKTQAIFDNELKTLEAIKNGTLDRSWVDKVLKEKGREFLD